MPVRQLRRIARIDDIDKLHALHDTPVPHIQTRNNPLRQHLAITSLQPGTYFLNGSNWQQCLRYIDEPFPSQKQKQHLIVFRGLTYSGTLKSSFALTFDSRDENVAIYL